MRIFYRRCCEQRPLRISEAGASTPHGIRVSLSFLLFDVISAFELPLERAREREREREKGELMWLQDSSKTPRENGKMCLFKCSLVLATRTGDHLAGATIIS